MIKTLLFLTALGLTQGAERSLTVFHPNCPSSGHALLPHEYDCTKFYYCEGGQKFVNPRDCPPRTEFSATQQVCIHPELADCKLPGYSTVASPDATTNLVPNPDPTPQAPTAAPTAVPSGAPTAATSVNSQAPNDGTTDDCDLLDNGCPFDFNVHKLLPHETSCRKFYYCVRGEKVLSSCPKGNVFNPAIERCDHAANVDRTCEDDSSSQEDSNQDDDDVVDIVFLPNGCPADWSITWLLPHSNCCNMFYQCNFGNYVEIHCAPGTHFNPELQRCDQLSNAACTLPGGTCAWDNGTPDVVVTTTTRPPIDLQENGCPADHSINWLVPHEDDCTKFYFCVWGDKQLSSCPAGLHFNAQSQICDNPADAGCQHLDCNTCDNCDNDDCSGTDDDNTSDNNDCTGTDCDTEVSGEDNDDCTGDNCNNDCTGDNCNNDCTGNDCNNDCTGNDCNNDCTGNDCNNDCTGDNCNNDCTGDNCNNDCTGNDCNNDCTGNDCNNDCTGNDCNNDCTGDDCNNDCTGNDCNNDCTGNDCNNDCTGNDCNNDCTGNDCNNDCTGDDCNNDCTGNDCNNDCTGDDCNNDCTGDACDKPSSEEDDLPVGDDPGEPDCSDETPEDNNKCVDECNVLPWAHDDCDKYWTCDGQNPLLVVCTEGLHFNPSTHTCDFACNAGCVRENAQATASHDGLKLFLPWNKIDDNTRSLLKLIAH